MGRYGPRTGRRIREEIKKIEDNAKRNKCPNCNKKVVRKSAGIWECGHCGLKFASGTYLTTTGG